ncbi:Hypothetical_protein [Hexamita inflata]|uniref:Hypothetical_protein n=1 Tax=Hexamita inflata TaxID=28002 RepID=A0AA86QL34_9EUKA|nr:Hypothetical protein HINF_LOCUS42759 [Hexamita inflata]
MHLPKFLFQIIFLLLGLTVGGQLVKFIDRKSKRAVSELESTSLQQATSYIFNQNNLSYLEKKLSSAKVLFNISKINVVSANAVMKNTENASVIYCVLNTDIQTTINTKRFHLDIKINKLACACNISADNLKLSKIQLDFDFSPKLLSKLIVKFGIEQFLNRKLKNGIPNDFKLLFDKKEPEKKVDE